MLAIWSPDIALLHSQRSVALRWSQQALNFAGLTAQAFRDHLSVLMPSLRQAALVYDG